VEGGQQRQAAHVAEQDRPTLGCSSHGLGHHPGQVLGARERLDDRVDDHGVELAGHA
jgi:hypothetical protein